MLASSLARKILAADSERAEFSAELGRLLQDDKTYRCLLTILGIGPKSASVLAASIDTSLFLRDSKLAAYCGLTPADHDSGSSIRSRRDAHKGNKALKILLIFSCNSLVGTKRCFGKHYDVCVARA
jgi:transposase